MKLIIALLVIGLLVGCAAKEAVKDTEVASEMPVPGADVEETVVVTEETTDLTTSQNTFGALDEAVGELE